MKYLLALDPSVRSAGAAIYQDERLVACVQIKGNLPTSAELGARCLDVGMRAASWGVGCMDRRGFGTIDVVFEWPHIRAATKAKGDPNDLPGLAGVGMACAARLQGLCDFASIRTPLPADWIGSVPKVCQACRGIRSSACKACGGSTWHTPRGKRIAERLEDTERALVPDQHDVIDAVGLGLWALGRLTLRGVFPGAI